MKRMRWSTGEPQGFAGTGASARWSAVMPSYGFDHVVACAANGMGLAKAIAQRPLGFGGATG